MGKYRIWWSPMGYPNGTDTIQADSKSDADAQAQIRMNQFSNMGAWGSEKFNVHSKEPK